MLMNFRRIHGIDERFWRRSRKQQRQDGRKHDPGVDRMVVVVRLDRGPERLLRGPCPPIESPHLIQNEMNEVAPEHEKPAQPSDVRPLAEHGPERDDRHCAEERRRQDRMPNATVNRVVREQVAQPNADYAEDGAPDQCQLPPQEPVDVQHDSERTRHPENAEQPVDLVAVVQVDVRRNAAYDANSGQRHEFGRRGQPGCEGDSCAQSAGDGSRRDVSVEVGHFYQALEVKRYFVTVF